RRGMLGRDTPERRQRAAGRVDAIALDGRSPAIAEIQDAPVRAYREARRPAGGRRLADWRELARGGIDTEPHDLVVVLQANVQHVRHVVPPTSLSWARLGRRGPSPATACGAHLLYPSAFNSARCRLRRCGRSWANRCTPAKIESGSRCASAI